MLLIALLAPGTWLRSTVGDRASADVTVTALPFDNSAVAGFEVLGLWQLHGFAENFGGYSAMAPPGPEIVRLFSDKGWLLTIPRPDARRGPAGIRQLYPTGIPVIDLLDIESVTYHPQTGQYWVGYESRHTIYRYSVTGEPEAFVEPAYTTGWQSNGGIEAMARLADGRFLVLHEDGNDGYLYPGDPVEGAVPQQFTVAWPEDYSPTDMAQLPDGRVLILLRKVAWHLPVFESLIALADPALIDSALIDSASPWPVTVLAELEQLVPRDNWEALSIEPPVESVAGAIAGGAVNVWLASDDNRSAVQRSLLAKLRWTPPQPEQPEPGQTAEN
ncbi:MAG TPA: esterase-like activity of phytase family protein [Paracoccaceae bacterium]|nr:esterase-like activity of phytase family protein [Paracoccaceae bacterium]